MDVSIIIPAYNVEKYIEQCLDTVLNQRTNYEYEVICVNDGSTDATYDILKKYEERITLISTDNKGPGAARNLALKHAKGKYIMFVDGDDYVLDTFVEKMMTEIIENDADVVICNFYRFIDNDSNIEKVNKGKYKIYHKGDIGQVLLMEFHSCNKAFRRELIENNKYPENMYFEDVVTISKALIDAKKIVKIEDYLYYYRRTKNSITNNLTDSNYDIIKALDLISDKFTKNGYQQELEFLNINNLLVDLAIKVLKAKKDINEYLKVTNKVNDKYPGWYKNKYIKKTKFTKRLYLFCLKNRLYRLIEFCFSR